MEQTTRLVNLPVIGRIQHGEKDGNKLKQLSYFIAKIDSPYMKKYAEKFDELYKGKQYIDIKFIDEEPLSVKYSRYNQSGEMCSSVEYSGIAKQRTQNGFKNVECDTYTCPYREKNECGKCSCNRIGWLKFMIPKVCESRVFLMRITSQTSIERIKDFITLQKMQGIPVLGEYVVFLKEEEQTPLSGKKFKNYILDIIHKEDFNSIQLGSENQNSKDNLIEQNNKVNSNESIKSKNEINKESKINTSDKETSVLEQKNDVKSEVQEQVKIENYSSQKEKQIKSKKGKSKKDDDNILNEDSPKEKKDEFENFYSLFGTHTEKIANKDYLIGQFVDTNDNMYNIVLRPEDAKEIIKCHLGTVVKLETTEINGKLFAIKLEFIEKMLKEKVA